MNGRRAKALHSQYGIGHVHLIPGLTPWRRAQRPHVQRQVNRQLRVLSERAARKRNSERRVAKRRNETATRKGKTR